MLQFWLNGKQAFDIDLLHEKRSKGHDALIDTGFAVDDWIRLRKDGLCLSVVAPYSNELAALQVQIRCVAVRPLKTMEPHQANARMRRDFVNELPPYRDRKHGHQAPPPQALPREKEESGNTEIQPR